MLSTRWLSLLCVLFLCSAALWARPSKQVFDNASIGIHYQASDNALLLTDPSLLQRVMTEGLKQVELKAPPSQLKSLGLQFVVAPKALAKPPFAPNLNIVTEKLPYAVSQEAYLQANLNSLKAGVKGFTLLSKGQTVTIGGWIFKQIEFEGDGGGARIRARQFYHVSAGRKLAYAISLTDLAARKGANTAALEKLLSGFRFKD